MLVYSLLVISFLNELELICLRTSIAIASTHLNDISYWYLAMPILFDMNHLFVYSEVVTSIAI